MTTLTLLHSPHRRRAFRLLLLSEVRIAWRRPAGLVVAVGVPLALLIVFGSIPATTRPLASLGGVSFFELYVPTLLVFVLLAVGVGGLPQQLATYREQGVLRRLSTTPVSPSWLLAAQMAVNVVLATIAITLLLGVGVLAFGLTLPPTVPSKLLSLLSLILTVAATLGLGLCTAALASSPQIANAASALLFYVLAFFSGLYVPLQSIHSTVIHDISRALPTGAGYNALHAAFLGQSLGAEPLLVLAGWAVATSVAAARLFRWE